MNEQQPRPATSGTPAWDRPVAPQGTWYPDGRRSFAPPGPRAAREQAEVDAELSGARPAHPDTAGTQHDTGSFGHVPAGHGGGAGPGSNYPAGANGGRRERRRHGWFALGGTAATAALLASLGTATLTGALDEAPAASPGAVEPASVSQVAQVTTSDWAAVTAEVRESVVALEVTTRSGGGEGSGVVLDSDGHVLTNSHVVDGARDVTVTLADGRIYQAEPVGQDETTDLAVVRIVDPPQDLAPATLGTSQDLVVGQAVLAVGNPLGLDSTATTGIISALDRPVVTQSRTSSVVTNAIQVDAAVNPGNSGGPLFDAAGEVIGINSSIATVSGASGNIGLGFAIPVDQAAGVAEQLIEHGEAEHAFLGVGLGEATVEVDGVTRAGAEVRQVEAGSPAAEAELREGDVITAIDGRAVDSAAALTGYVRQHSSGEETVLTVVRDGAAHEITVTLAAREA